MKARVGIALACGLIALAAFGDVFSVNQVGYNRVVLSPGGVHHLVGLGFDPFDATLLGVFGTNQLRGSATSPLFCDLVLRWNAADQVYERYAFNTTDMTFRWATNFSGPPVNPVIESGDGLWIISAAAGPYAGQSNTIYLMGEVVDVLTNEVPIVGGGVGTPAYNLICNPFSCDVELNAMRFLESGAYGSGSPVLTDRILLWTGTGYKQYGLKPDGTWREMYPVNRWNEPTGTVATVSLGEGIWYSAANSFTWIPTNTYLHNLR